MAEAASSPWPKVAVKLEEETVVVPWYWDIQLDRWVKHLEFVARGLRRARWEVKRETLQRRRLEEDGNEVYLCRKSRYPEAYREAMLVRIAQARDESELIGTRHHKGQNHEAKQTRSQAGSR